ncbi:MAG: hypothetical protein ACYC3N_05620 [Halothiobacillus sp.]
MHVPRLLFTLFLIVALGVIGVFMAFEHPAPSFIADTPTELGFSISGAPDAFDHDPIDHDPIDLALPPCPLSLVMTEPRPFLAVGKSLITSPPVPPPEWA